MSRDNSISITRIMAMLMIILCHWFGSVPALSQLFNVGVTIFFFISGYVYADRKINDYRGWYTKRWAKICIPTYVLAIYQFALELIKNHHADFIALGARLININGIEFIFKDIKIPEYSPWFILVIMLCYVQLMLHKAYESKRGEGYLISPVYYIVLIILQAALAILLHIQIGYFMTFLMGYVFGKKKKEINIKSYLIYSIIMIVGMAVRFGSRALFDGSIMYTDVIVFYTQFTLALWVFETVRFIRFLMGDTFDKLATSKFILFVDGVSLFVYLAHGFPMAYMLERYNTLFGLLITVVLSIVAGWILKMATEVVYKIPVVRKYI